MLMVWRGLTGTYGERFVAAYGDSYSAGPAETWARALIGFTPKDIQRGLDECSRRPNHFVPTLPEFRALCLGSKDAPARAMSENDRQIREMDEHEADKAHFRKMRDLAAQMGPLGLDGKPVGLKDSDGNPMWAHEAEHGIPHRAHPRVKYNPIRVRKLMEEIAGMFK